MENTLLDDVLDSEEKPLLTIGILFCLNIFTFSYLISNILREGLMYLKITPVMNFWITEVLVLLLIILISVLFIKNYQENNLKRRDKLILKLAIFYFLGLTMKFLFQNYFIQFLSTEILFEIKKFNNEIIDNKIYRLLFLIIEFITYSIIFIFIYRKKQLKVNVK